MSLQAILNHINKADFKAKLTTEDQDFIIDALIEKVGPALIPAMIARLMDEGCNVEPVSAEATADFKAIREKAQTINKYRGMDFKQITEKIKDDMVQEKNNKHDAMIFHRKYNKILGEKNGLDFCELLFSQRKKDTGLITFSDKKIDLAGVFIDACNNIPMFALKQMDFKALITPVVKKEEPKKVEPKVEVKTEPKEETRIDFKFKKTRY